MRYRYLGAGRIEGVLYNAPDVENNVFNASDVYDGLDSFDRIDINRWVKGGSPGADIYKVTLAYDRNSSITDVDDSVQSGLDWKYTYDDLDRLSRARAGTLSGGSITSETRDQNWTLDHAGNWDTTTFDLNADDVYTGGGEYDWDFTQNKANEITAWDDQTNSVVPTYDAAGNLTDDKRDSKYEYDAWYRLVKVKNQSNTVLAEFKYNGLRHRIGARYGGAGVPPVNPWLHFAYDERWRIVAMFEDGGAGVPPVILREQFWHHNAGASGFGGSSYIDDVVLRDKDASGGGSLDERRYYLQNWHHDMVAILNASGTVIERTNFDAYGQPIGTFTTIGNRRGYAGYEIDPQLTKHYHVRHRVLRSDLGVWTRRDPLGYLDAQQLYLYGRSNPGAFVDPSGLDSCIVPYFCMYLCGPAGPLAVCTGQCQCIIPGMLSLAVCFYMLANLTGCCAFSCVVGCVAPVRQPSSLSFCLELAIDVSMPWYWGVFIGSASCTCT